MSIHTLADDYLATIFKFLPYSDRLNMENVCEKWKRISKFQAWNEVDKFFAGDFYFFNQEHFGDRKPPQEIIEKVIIRCGQFLNRLILGDYIESSIMRVVADHCCNVTYLQLGFHVHNTMDYVGVFEKLIKLHTIKILTHYSTKFDPQNFLSLTADINTIYYSVGLYGDTPSRSWCSNFSSVISKCHVLHSLNLREIKFDKSTFKIITKIPTLKHLGLIFCKLPSNCKKIKKLVNLESLELERITNMENDFLQTISENLNNLKSIAIKNLMAPKITRQGFYLFSVPQSLKSIRICMMEREIDNTVFFQFQNLIKLECCGCLLVTDVAIKRVLANCPALEVLNVMGTAVTVATIQLADIATRRRFGSASKLHVFIHQNIIKDFECLNTPANRFLVLQHDVFWQNQTRVFN